MADKFLEDGDREWLASYFGPEDSDVALVAKAKNSKTIGASPLNQKTMSKADRSYVDKRLKEIKQSELANEAAKSAAVNELNGIKGFATGSFTTKPAEPMPEEPKKNPKGEVGNWEDTPDVKFVFGDPAEEWLKEPGADPSIMNRTEFEDLEWITRPDVHMALKLNDYNHDQKQIDELVNKPVREQAQKMQSWQTARVTSENYWSERNRLLAQIAELESNPVYNGNPTGRDIAIKNFKRQLAEVESEGRKIDSWYDDTRAPSQFPRYWVSKGEPEPDGDTNQPAQNEGNAANAEELWQSTAGAIKQLEKSIKPSSKPWTFAQIYNSAPPELQQVLTDIRNKGGEQEFLNQYNAIAQQKQGAVNDAGARVTDANNFRKAVNDPNTERAMIDAAVRGDARAFTDLAIQSGTNVARREGTAIDKVLGMIGITPDKVATKSAMDAYLKTADQNFVKEAKAKLNAEQAEAEAKMPKKGDEKTVKGKPHIFDGYSWKPK